jgi:hypothetical protein
MDIPTSPYVPHTPHLIYRQMSVLTESQSTDPQVGIASDASTHTAPRHDQGLLNPFEDYRLMQPGANENHPLGASWTAGPSNQPEAHHFTPPSEKLLQPTPLTSDMKSRIDTLMKRIKQLTPRQVDLMGKEKVNDMRHMLLTIGESGKIGTHIGEKIQNFQNQLDALDGR